MAKSGSISRSTWSADVCHPIHATRVLCEVAGERGVAARQVLAGTGVSPADLDDPDGVISAHDEILAVRHLQAELPDGPGLGIDVGGRSALTHMGLFGFAVMSCATLRELFSIGMRYFALTTLQIDLQLFEGVEDCVLELNAGHLPSDVQHFFIERDIAGIIATTASFAYPVVAQYADRISAEVSIDEEVLQPILTLMPLPNVEFGRAHSRLHFPRAMLDEPLPQADPYTLELCIAQCDALMQRYEHRRGITAVVRSKLFRDSGQFPALPEVAAELDMHPRTLRRRLAEEGTSFRALVNEARSALARDLLCNVGLTVDEVSRRLGYTETSTFCHAFKRWHGVAPSAWSRPQGGRSR
ncbi:AraC family transcriptional regulator [Mycolicibacterium neworleansense]|uniref:Transcriptional regulator n=1 Tax=Mycolicibacterium neworleansense TaxID=146018 RepID=A0A0H5RLH8_9MYCO|nr:AraC family transcriptional regulator [Mycolicibacterium neworleansense]MCV7360469.1 AraC family transcriptional regulator ligand-binding domain-containing protein [Mycolicibacterium neworleansense]CRZ14641.1 transcriptional regulator [Mycolicibacterium neworleansense]